MKLSFQDKAFGIVPIFLTSPGEFSNSLFLIIQHQAGHWGFPKGHAELWETPIATACREFTEETGITQYKLIEEKEFVERYEFVKKGITVEKTVTYFLAIALSTTVHPQAEEIQDYAWKPFEEAKNQITYEANRRIITEVQHYLELNQDKLLNQIA